MEDLNSIVEEKMEICKGLTGEERSEFIEMTLEDYNFATHIVNEPKVLKHYSDLFAELIKNFGH